MSEFDQYDEPAAMGAEQFEALAAQHGYEIVDDDEYEYEDDYVDDNPEPQQQQPTTDAILRDFNAHLDDLERSTGMKLSRDERKAFTFEVLDTGQFTPAMVEERFAHRLHAYESGLIDKSRSKEVPAHVRRNARRERMARAIDKENGKLGRPWR